MKPKEQTLLWLIILFLSVSLSAQRSAMNIEKEVSRLIKEMTLEEKIGQMTQVTMQAVAEQEGTTEQKTIISPEKLHMAIVDYHVGSLLNVWGIALTPQEWHQYIGMIEDIATKETRLKIPVLYGIDAIHGATYTIGSTIFPQNIAMAATWNPDLVRESAAITAREIRACGIPWNFNPVLGLGRNPLWPRLFETFGEDTYAASVFGKAYVEGVEGPGKLNSFDHAAACMKHYAGYSIPLSGRDRTPAWIPRRMLRELFLPPFKAAVDAGVHTVMVNSTEVNGIPVHSSHFLLTEVLRDEMGFKGFVVSDWMDIINLHTREKVADSPKEAVRMAVMAGIDMSMVPYDFSFYDLLLELVKEGSVPMSRIDEAVSRILQVKFELGLFANPYPKKELIENIGTDESALISLEAAGEAITLLKNEKGLLPLKKGSKILVTGPTAEGLRFINSGWTYTWQGDKEELYPKEKQNILQAIEKLNGAENILYAPGTYVDEEIDIEQATVEAMQADVVVLCLGENPYCETPGNINDLALPGEQIKLAEALLETGKPIVLVLAEGRPRLITKIAEKIPAIIMAYLPGNEGGIAIAKTIFGDINPSGKLPITYPKYHNQRMNYDYKTSEIQGGNEYDVLFPFGHGLSYTTFDYDDLEINKEEFDRDDTIEMSVSVENSGDVAGKEAVLLFIGDDYRSVTPPVKQLKGFKKIFLEADEEKTVSFRIKSEDLSFIGRDNKRLFEPGSFTVSIGDLKKTFFIR